MAAREWKGRGAWWGGVLGALLLACEPLSGTARDAPPEGTAQGLKQAPLAKAGREALVGPEFPVNQPVQRMLETLVAGPAVAFDGEHYLAVWTDERRATLMDPFGRTSLFGARVKKDGTVLDAAGFLVAEPRPTSEQLINLGTPAVAFDGERFLVLWEGQDDNRDVFYSRVTRDGTSLDPQGLRLPTFFGGVGARPEIACDGAGTCLAVRTNFTEEDEPGPEGFAILGGVLLRDGAVVGTEPLRIADAPAAPRSVSVAWSGREFLVVWEDLRSDTGEGDIFAARVARDGTVLDPDGFPVTTAAGDQRAPDVEWTGSHFLVVWEERVEGSTDVAAARVTSSATVRDPGGFPITTAAGEQREPRVASGGGATLVVWTDTRTGRPRVRATRVRGDDVLDGSGFSVSRSLFTQDTPDVVFGGERFFVAFGAVREGTFRRTVLASRVETDGDVVDESATRVLIGPPAQLAPAAAFGGGNYLVAWQDDRDDAGTHIRAARVRRDGTFIEQQGIRLPSAPGAMEPAVAFDGRNFLVVWREPGADADRIRGARVSSSGKVLDGDGLFIASTGHVFDTLEKTVSVAFGGGRYLVAWTDETPASPTDTTDVRGTRVSTGGTVLDPAGFRIGPKVISQRAPAVAFVGGRFVVALRETNFTFPDLVSRVIFVRVTTGGAVLDPDGIFLADTAGAPAIASAGSQALVVWDQGSLLVTPAIVGARVTGDGEVLDPGGFPIVPTPSGVPFPSATFDGERYWVAWEDRERTPGTVDITGARVRTDGTVVDPDGVTLSSVPFTESYSPALASDGQGDAAVFYSRFAAGRTLNNFRVMGRRLD